MKFVCAALIFFATAVAWAESANDTYIERYPGDGMGARAKKVPTRKIGENPLLTVLPEQETSPVATPGESSQTTTNKASRAARYISPRVGSKDFAPSRLPEPKAKTVVVPKREGKFPPSPKVSDKVDRSSLGDLTSSTNQPPSAVP